MYRFLFLVPSLIVFLVSMASAELVIIVNKDNPANNIPMSKLKQVYTGDLKLWDNSKKVVPVDLSEKDPMAIKFVTTVLGVDMDTKRAYWIKKVFSGAGTPPHVEKDEKSVVKFVATEAGAIGYVQKENVDNSVKVITLDGKSEF